MLNRLTHPSSIDLTISGGLSGKMTKLSRYHDYDWGCSTSMVRGERQWHASFAGVVGAEHMLFTVTVLRYAGPGTYDDPALLDDKGSLRPEINRLVLVWLSTIPPNAPDVTEYATYPDPRYAPTFKPPIGQASFTLDPDQKSGHITAGLMNARAIAEAPVTVSGTFKCGVLDSR